jgi:CubicO group peptidase (beta-lactamase class C family)
MSDALLPLPAADPSVRWPTTEWEHGPFKTGDPERVEELVSFAFTDQPRADLGLTLAVLCVQGGRIVVERYGPEVDHATPLISWSMAKSITQALLGILVHDGDVHIDNLVGAPEWAGDAGRMALDVRTLLRMRSGLHWVEDYVDGDVSTCLQMLFGEGAQDMAAFAAAQPLVAEPDTVFNYSSGTTNILARLVGQIVHANGSDIASFMNDRLFGPLGMTSAVPTIDPAGTFVGSSYVHATARDFARFGYLYLRDGVWDGQRLLAEGWVDRARTLVSVDDTPMGYGEHFWIRPDDPLGTFFAAGYEGQSISVVPALDLVVVRLGKSPVEHAEQLRQWRWDLHDAFAID